MKDAIKMLMLKSVFPSLRTEEEVYQEQVSKLMSMFSTVTRSAVEYQKAETERVYADIHNQKQLTFLNFIQTMADIEDRGKLTDSEIESRIKNDYYTFMGKSAEVRSMDADTEEKLMRVALMKKVIDVVDPSKMPPELQSHIISVIFAPNASFVDFEQINMLKKYIERKAEAETSQTESEAKLKYHQALDFIKTYEEKFKE